jgi:hypothetical protein
MEAGWHKEDIVFRKTEAEYFSRTVWTARGALNSRAKITVRRSLSWTYLVPPRSFQKTKSSR